MKTTLLILSLLVNGVFFWAILRRLILNALPHFRPQWRLWRFRLLRFRRHLPSPAGLMFILSVWVLTYLAMLITHK